VLLLPFFEIFPQQKPVEGWQCGLKSVLDEQSFFGPPAHVPRWHRSAESSVQRLPSSHGVPSARVIVLQRPRRQRSGPVQQLRSSQIWPSGSAGPTHLPVLVH
jgi:hypothetical protein